MDEKNILSLTCEQVSELISEYIDGELDESTAAAVASHIDNCADCRRLYDEISAVCRAVADIGEVQIPDGLHERIMSTVSTQKRASRRRRTITYLGIGVAAMLCISVVSSTLVQRMGTNADDLIVISESTDASYGAGPADTASKDKITAEGMHDGANDIEAELTDSMASTPEEPAYDETDGWHDSTADITPQAVTTPAPSSTHPVPETTAEYPEDNTKRGDIFTQAPAEKIETEALPEYSMPDEFPAEESPDTTAMPEFTMAATPTEALKGEPSYDIEYPSAEGSPNYSISLSELPADFDICTVWTWKDTNGVSHSLNLRNDGTFTYTHGAKTTEGSFTFENGILTLRYGTFARARYSVGVYKGDIVLLHKSGRKLLK